MPDQRSAHAEVGEPFVTKEPLPRGEPASIVVDYDAPAVGVVPEPSDSAGTETPPEVSIPERSRPPSTRAIKLVRVDIPDPQMRRSIRSAVPQARTPRPLGWLIRDAEAAELGMLKTRPGDGWRRLITSPCTAWIAVIIFIGLPLFSLYRSYLLSCFERRALLKD
jgi:hypothetical protein